MDIEKSLYMADFLKIRETLGKVELYPLVDTLFINLYDEVIPKQQSEEVEEAIEEIQDKTIQFGEQGQHTFFSPELVEEEEEEEEAKIPEEIKVIKISEEISKGGGPTMKTITFNPNYVAKD